MTTEPWFVKYERAHKNWEAFNTRPTAEPPLQPSLTLTETEAQDGLLAWLRRQWWGTR